MGHARPTCDVTIGARSLPCGPSALEVAVREAVVAAARVLRRRPPRLSVAIVGDRLMRRLNRDFHATDRTTDVLAFPLDDELVGLAEGPEAEIVVCAPQARREARYRGLAYEVELLLYVVHGVLHLLGEDDGDPEGAARMRRLEMRAMDAIGRPLPPSHAEERK